MHRDEETLACALMVERQHGERAPVHVAVQLGRLAAEADWDGVVRWKEIAAVIDAEGGRIEGLE